MRERASPPRDSERERATTRATWRVVAPACAAGAFRHSRQISSTRARETRERRRARRREVTTRHSRDMSATRGRVDHFIHGAWVRANRSMPVVTPHDNRIIGSIAAGDARAVDDAVRAARDGFKVWSAESGRERSRVLRAIARGIEKRKDALAALETEDMGKPIEESAWDVEDASACFDYYADRCEEMFGDRSYAEEEVKLPMDNSRDGCVERRWASWD